MRGVFVTGTDTGVGKTQVALALLRAFVRAGLHTVGMKPVASGTVLTPDGLRNEDAQLLQQAASLPKPYELVNPYAFIPPIAPHIAATEAGMSIELPRILKAFHQLCEGADVAVVEGVGGWQVPLSDTLGMPDVVRALALPVILVVGLRLGCLNHALLSTRAIRSDGLKLAGWVANGIDPHFERHAENLITLTHGINAPLLSTIPYQSAPSADPMTDCFDAENIIRLLGGSGGHDSWV